MKRLTQKNGIVILMSSILMMPILHAQQGGGNNGGNEGGDPKKPKKSGYHVIVEPDSVILDVGAYQQFSAYLEDSTGVRQDTTFTWSIAGHEIGTLSDEGLFLALEKGTTHVVASAGQVSGKAIVEVTGDPSGKNTRKKGLKIDVQPNSVVLAVGDTLTWTAVCTDSQGQVIDTTFSWSVDGDYAAITENGFMEVISEGKGFVYASIGDLAGKGHLLVRAKPDNPAQGAGQKGRRNLYRLVISPSDTSLLVGETVQFEAFLQDTAGNRLDTTVTWKLTGKKIGSLSETGFFTADTGGICMVQAKINQYSAVARVMVMTEEDAQNQDPVQIRLHDRDGNQVGGLKRLSESDILKISGLPFPLNIFNGGELVLPPGSLNEGITIEITLPDLAEIKGDTSVTFQDAVLMGFSFDVYVNGEKVSPYEFDTPVQVVLPYKPELMEALGLTLEDLAVFFYNEDGSYDETDIFNVVVDTTENKVYAEVKHFSQVILGDKSLLSSTHVDMETMLSPVTCRLHGNYPNPFNPETVIRYDVAGLATQYVSLRIFNVLGQPVYTLIETSQEPGQYAVSWNGRDEQNFRVSSGVYFIRLEAGGRKMTRRMLLLQ